MKNALAAAALALLASTASQAATQGQRFSLLMNTYQASISLTAGIIGPEINKSGIIGPERFRVKLQLSADGDTNHAMIFDLSSSAGIQDDGLFTGYALAAALGLLQNLTPAEVAGIIGPEISITSIAGIQDNGLRTELVAALANSISASLSMSTFPGKPNTALDTFVGYAGKLGVSVCK